MKIPKTRIVLVFCVFVSSLVSTILSYGVFQKLHRNKGESQKLLLSSSQLERGGFFLSSPLFSWRGQQVAFEQFLPEEQNDFSQLLTNQHQQQLAFLQKVAARKAMQEAGLESAVQAGEIAPTHNLVWQSFLAKVKGNPEFRMLVPLPFGVSADFKHLPQLIESADSTCANAILAVSDRNCTFCEENTSTAMAVAEEFEKKICVREAWLTRESKKQEDALWFQAAYCAAKQGTDAYLVFRSAMLRNSAMVTIADAANKARLSVVPFEACRNSAMARNWQVGIEQNLKMQGVGAGAMAVNNVVLPHFREQPYQELVSALRLRWRALP